MRGQVGEQEGRVLVMQMAQCIAELSAPLQGYVLRDWLLPPLQDLLQSGTLQQVHYYEMAAALGEEAVDTDQVGVGQAAQLSHPPRQAYSSQFCFQRI